MSKKSKKAPSVAVSPVVAKKLVVETEAPIVAKKDVVVANLVAEDPPTESKETLDTGVIYKITNKFDGKFYIGKAFSYVKNGNQPIRKHGAQDRFERHWFKSHSEDEKARNECPFFYEALRKSQESDWTVETLVICSKKHLKEYEARKIKEYKSGLPENGYNVLIGDNKPAEGAHKEAYEIKKAASNRDRATDGQMKRNGKNTDLPANISRRVSNLPNGNVAEGYFVQIKIKDKLYNKAFMSKKDSDEQKLVLAKEYLANLKKEHGL